MTARRGFLRSACRWCAGLGGLGFAGLAASQDLAPAALPPRFARPPAETDEGGLWALMDREEQRLRRSPFVVRDDRLTRYLEGVVCRLGADHCIDVRVHVVRNPLFNASMAPNGMMQVWSGLLLRMENEAQLAAVLGHELGHYLERHSVERLRDSRSRAAFAQLMGVFGIAGTVAQWGIMAGMFSFTREQEARADRLGLGLMLRAGYDPAQAARVWDNLLGEIGASRGVTVAQVQAVVDQEGLIRAAEALGARLIDRTAYRDEIYDALKAKTGRAGSEKPFKQVSLAAYARQLKPADALPTPRPVEGVAPASAKAGRIAIVYAEGEIVDGEGSPDEIGGARLSRELRKLRQDKNVRAVVLRVNSPGGSAAAS